LFYPLMALIDYKVSRWFLWLIFTNFVFRDFV
jgi:hypothetical protein